jgi:hypothetical protein
MDSGQKFAVDNLVMINLFLYGPEMFDPIRHYSEPKYYD